MSNLHSLCKVWYLSRRSLSVYSAHVQLEVFQNGTEKHANVDMNIQIKCFAELDNIFQLFYDIIDFFIYIYLILNGIKGYLFCMCIVFDLFVFETAIVAKYVNV